MKSLKLNLKINLVYRTYRKPKIVCFSNHIEPVTVEIQQTPFIPDIISKTRMVTLHSCLSKVKTEVNFTLLIHEFPYGNIQNTYQHIIQIMSKHETAVF